MRAVAEAPPIGTVYAGYDTFVRLIAAAIAVAYGRSRVAS